MSRRIPRREFLTSLSAMVADAAASRFPRRSLLASGSLAAKPKSQPTFQVKSLKGVDFVLRNSPTSRKYLIETMPGGVALLDYNNDGLLDIFLVNAGRVRDPMLKGLGFDRRNPAYWNRLYRQNKDGSFTDVTRQAGLT